MGRRQKPVEQVYPPLAELALELRELRAHAGLTMQQLGSKAHYAKSRVSEAESGRKLPPWKLVEVYLREGAPEADRAAWLRRWNRLEKDLEAERQVVRQAGEQPQGSSAARMTAANRNVRAPLDSPSAFLHDLRVLLGEQRVSFRAVALTAGCSVSTVSTTLNSGVLPRWERVEQFLRAAHVTEHGLSSWRQRWQRLKALQHQAMGNRLAVAGSEATANESLPSLQAAGAGGPADDQEDLPAQAVLAETVRQRCRDELNSLRIHDPLPLPVTWATDETLSDHWPEVRRASLDASLGPLRLSGRYEQIARTYLQIPSGRLVILGASGSGKSVLIRQLTYDLLGQRAPGSPVPVVFTLSSWNPQTQTLREWLTDELHHTYGLPTHEPWSLRRMFRRRRPSPAWDLIDRGAILPIFDSFDEIHPRLRVDALRQINASGMPVILTSRSSDYAATRDVGGTLNGAAAIELQPLTADDAINYLRRTTPPRAGRTKWDPVGRYLRSQPDSALARTLTNPFIVMLARQTYSNSPADPVELTDPSYTSVSIESRLLDAVIPTSAHRFHQSPRQIDSWLAYFAAQATASPSNSLRVDRLDASVSATARRLLTCLPALISMITTVGVASVWTGEHAGRAITMIWPVLVMIIAGTYATVLSPRSTPHPGRRGHEWRLAGAIAAITASGYAMTTMYNWAASVMTTLIAVMPMLRIDRWIRLKQTRRADRPEDLHPATPRLAVAELLISSLVSVVMMLASLVTLLADMVGPGFWSLPQHHAATYGMAGGLLAYGVALTGWGQWLLTVRCWLPVRRQIPWRLLTFLEIAHTVGILRRQGPHYYFRHHILQDALTQPYRTHSRPARSPAATALLLVSIAVAAAAGVWAANIAVHALPALMDSFNAAEQGDTIKKIINVFSAIIGVVAVIMIIYAGFKYISSGGDSGNVTSAKTTMIYALLGLVIVATAQFMVQFVLERATGSANNTPELGSLPGPSVALTISNGIMFFSLLFCLLGLILSAGLWAVGAFSNNYTQSVNGKKGFLFCAGAALAIGAAFFLVSYFFDPQQAVR